MRARKLAGVTSLVVAICLGHGSAGAVEVTGKWRFSFPGHVELVDVVQAGNTATFTYLGTPLTVTIQPDGTFSGNNYASPVCAVGLHGTIFPDGNVMVATQLSYGGVPPCPGGFPDQEDVRVTRCSCDDGNTLDGDGCSAQCRVEPCFTCAGSPSVCSPSPDGAPCDDGHDCSTGETCTGGACGGGSAVVPCIDATGVWTLQVGFPSTQEIVTQRGSDIFFSAEPPGWAGVIDPATGAVSLADAGTGAVCGLENAISSIHATVAPDGNSLSGAGVIYSTGSHSCPGTNVTVAGQRTQSCGDGTIDGGEACDDDNIVAGDGCSPFCQVEQCWTCSGSPSVCSLRSGDPCDDGNPCTGGDRCTAGGCIPATVLPGAPCDDHNPCTVDACDFSGHCAGTPVPTGTACDDAATCSQGTCNGSECIASAPGCAACTGCQPGVGCVASPRPVCLGSTDPERGQLKLKRSPTSSRDRFSWSWPKGAALGFPELGHPTSADGYTLCLYTDEASPTLLFRATAPPGNPWTTNGRSKYAYRNAATTPEGVLRLTVVSGTVGKSRASALGNGSHLADRLLGLPSPPLPVPLRLQLQIDNGGCLETRYTAGSVLQNDPAIGSFRARGAP